MEKYHVGFSMGLILGPAIGGVLGGLNWRYPVILAICPSIFGTLLVFKILVESMPKERIEYLKYKKRELMEVNYPGMNAGASSLH